MRSLFICFLLGGCASAPVGYKTVEDTVYLHKDTGVRFPEKLGEYVRDNKTPMNTLDNLRMNYTAGEILLTARGERPGIMEQPDYAAMMALTEENKMGLTTLSKKKVPLRVGKKKLDVYELLLKTDSSHIETVHVVKGKDIYFQTISRAPFSEKSKAMILSRSALRALLDANKDLLN